MISAKVFEREGRTKSSPKNRASLMLLYVLASSLSSSSSFFSVCSVLISVSMYPSLLLKIFPIPTPHAAIINTKTMTNSLSASLTFFMSQKKFIQSRTRWFVRIDSLRMSQLSWRAGKDYPLVRWLSGSSEILTE